MVRRCRGGDGKTTRSRGNENVEHVEEHLGFEVLSSESVGAAQADDSF